MIHHIHLRVLNHIKNLSEQHATTSLCRRIGERGTIDEPAALQLILAPTISFSQKLILTPPVTAFES